MINAESIEWLSRASEHRDSRAALCWWAGEHTRDQFDRAMLVYGLVYCLDVWNGELGPENRYAWGWAGMARVRMLNRLDILQRTFTALEEVGTWPSPEASLESRKANRLATSS
jgi:hypothetical protein